MDDLVLHADVTVTTPDSENIVNTIQCDSSLTVANNATVTVNSGSGKHCSGVRVRGNAFLEEGTALNISVNPGAIETCKGLSVNGDLILRNNAALNVAIDDENATLSECIRVTGLTGIESGALLRRLHIVIIRRKPEFCAHSITKNVLEPPGFLHIFCSLFIPKFSSFDVLQF